MSLVCVGETCPERSAGHIPWNNCGRNIPWTSIIISNFPKTLYGIYIPEYIGWRLCLDHKYRQPYTKKYFYQTNMLYYGDIVRKTGRNNCWKFILLGSHQPSHPVPVGWSRDSRIIEAQPIYELGPLDLKKFEIYFIMEKYISIIER